MSKPYDPALHHRRSIRMNGHDYAGGGIYFVTICAHREFIHFANGNPFGIDAVGAHPSNAVGARPASPSSLGATQVSPGEGRATQVSPVRELIEERMRITAEKCPFMKWEAAVIMPDHFHALVRMHGGHAPLGDVIGGFKAAVTREIRRHRRGEACLALSPGNNPACPPPNIRIWHRNYYEMIVRTPEMELNIAEYIRMNPWKLVLHASHQNQSYRMIGNPALLNREKIAVLCSRNCPSDVLTAAKKRARAAGARHCFISGFHSPPEQAILDALLQSEAKLICCPAWGIDAMRIPRDWLPALETNRMLILEMRDRSGNLSAAEQRNHFVLDCAEKRWIPYISPGGMLARLAIVRATPVSPTPVSPTPVSP